MKIYLATLLTDPNQAEALTRAGIKHRLLSYFFIKGDGIIGMNGIRKGDMSYLLEGYVNKGTVTNRRYLK